MWRIFEKNGNIKLFLAKFNSQIVSAQLVIAFGDTVVNKFTVWSGEHGKYRPNEALMWGVMRWAKSHGYRHYDLEGIDRHTAEGLLRGDDLSKAKQSSHTSFKLGFGGKIVLFPKSYVYASNPIARWGYKNLMSQGTTPKLVQKTLNHIKTFTNR
jgi:lipid II:glycine glycyltransferase (peptidoglycan interpeptide bridge formation enzyme)